MEDPLNNLPTSHLLGSIPAVVDVEKNTVKHEVPEANIQRFPPNSGGGGSSRQGYQTLTSPTEGFEQQPPNSWNGVFSVSSYTQFFDVDTDVVITRLMSSLNPTTGDFFSKIDANPDLYGLVWISTTLIFVLASLGNFATYLMKKRTDSTTTWNFDVSYVHVAAFTVYGYAILVPLALYFLLQYMGSNASLIRFWCLWGYSLFILLLISFPMVIPLEFLRWIIILVAGTASACFVALNLRSYTKGNDLTVVVVVSFLLQLALSIFIKVWFFQ